MIGIEADVYLLVTVAVARITSRQVTRFVEQSFKAGDKVSRAKRSSTSFSSPEIPKIPIFHRRQAI